MKTLDALKPGQSAAAAAVHGQDAALRRRLLDLGITKGTKLTLVRTAPLGDPLEFSLRGYALTIRRSDAHCVEVA